MSPCFRSAFFYNVFIFCCIFSADVSFAAAEQAGLKIDGVLGNRFSKRHCNSASEVEVILPASALKASSDFRYRFIKVTDSKTKSGSGCEVKLADGAEVKGKFPKDKPIIAAGNFLTENACIDKGNGQSGERVLCIYDSDGGSELLAFASFSFSTQKAKIDDVTDITALNGEISFRVIYTIGANPVTIEVCVNKGTTVPENCSFKAQPSEHVVISGLTDHQTYSLKVRLKEGPNEYAEWHKVITESVTDSDATSMTLRAVVSARDSSSLWDLRCNVRERLIAFLAKYEEGRYLACVRGANVPLPP